MLGTARAGIVPEQRSAPRGVRMMKTPRSTRRRRRELKTHRVRATALLIVTTALAGILVAAAAAAIVALVFTWARGLSA